MFAISWQGVAATASSKQHLFMPLSNLEYDGIDYDIMSDRELLCFIFF